MNDQEFNQHKAEIVRENARSETFNQAAKSWHDTSRTFSYQYLFSWLGRPIIQDPQDVLALQEVIWQVRPDLIIETGVARGGSIMLSASLLALLDIDEAKQPGHRRVIGIDIDIREHNRKALESSGLSRYMQLHQGSSIDVEIIAKVQETAAAYDKVLIILDSDHTHQHVLAELKAYAPLVSAGSYALVLDTGIEDIPEDQQTHPRWGKGNNPKTAIDEYLQQLAGNADGALFERDYFQPDKNAISCAREGFLKRIK